MPGASGSSRRRKAALLCGGRGAGLDVLAAEAFVEAGFVVELDAEELLGSVAPGSATVTTIATLTAPAQSSNEAQFHDLA